MAQCLLMSLNSPDHLLLTGDLENYWKRGGGWGLQMGTAEMEGVGGRERERSSQPWRQLHLGQVPGLPGP